jgi:hypothetical protein
MHLHWSEPGWLTEATEWIDTHVERRAPIEKLHMRPWSAMLRAQTDDGPVYFKAPAPVLHHEAPLTRALARSYPDCIAKLLAINDERGWMLMAHSGEELGKVLAVKDGMERLHTLLARYARLQIELIPRCEEFVDLGVPDRRLIKLSHLASELGVDAQLVDRLVAGLSRFGLPETLVHEEVHFSNVLVRDDMNVFVDWSDCCVGHPFFGIVVTLRMVSDRYSFAPGHPELESLLKTYLEEWTSYAAIDDLRAAFINGNRLGMLNRALSWKAILDPLDPIERVDYPHNVDAWRRQFLEEESPLPGT